MRKIVLLCLAIITLIIFVQGVYAADVAYVVKSNNRVNTDITSVITELGYSYNVITELQIGSTDFSQYRLILVGNDIFQNPHRIPVNEQNSLIINQYHYYKKGTSDFQWGWSKEQSIVSRSFLQLNNNNNLQITQSIPNPFTAYNGGGVNAYVLGGIKPTGITYVSYSGSLNNKDYIVAFAEPGTVMLNGNTTKGRSLFFGLTESDYWTSDTRKLFKNSLEWSIKGQDKDLDGFFDNDCNDNDSSINPNATEIAYNRIDENCDKFDLADVDGDGYCKLGYLIMNKTLQCPNEGITSSGSDCDDNNLSINKGSSDLLNNCINDAPTQVSNISNIELEEDSSIEISIDSIRTHFSDPETNNNLLNVSISRISDNNITGTFNSSTGLFIFNSLSDWNGVAELVFVVSDGENLVESNNITLRVIPVNDNPVLQDIETQYIIAGKTLIIEANATDVDGDNLNYGFSSPFILSGNSTGLWVTNNSDMGNYNVIISVSDGNGGYDERNVEVIVMAKTLINEFAHSSNSDWVELYNPGNTVVKLNGCFLNNTLTSYDIQNGTSINPYSVSAFDIDNFIDDNGSIYLVCNEEVIDSIEFQNLPEDNSFGRISDGFDTDSVSDFKIYDIPTKNLSNSADMISPIINLITENNLILNQRDVYLEFNVSDNSQNISCELYTNTENNNFNVLKVLGGIIDGGIFSGNFTINNVPDGVYLWNVRCNDGTNYVFAPNNKTFSVSAPDAPTLDNIGNKIVIENQTLEFSLSGNDPENDTIIFSAEGLPSGAVFNSNNFTWKPGFNQSGNYIVRFIVTDSTNLSDSEEVSINVVDVKLPPAFNDVPSGSKCSVKDSKVSLDIVKPSVSRLNLGDEFETKVKVKNNLEDDSEFSVKVYLYDLTEDKVVEDVNGKLNVDSGDSGDISLTMKVPVDIENPDNNFAIYVYAESDENNCNTAYKEIKIEREKERLNIAKLEVVPDEQNPGEAITLKVRVENLGTNDQDAYIEIKNSELGINIKSDEFEIEKAGEKDRITKSFNFLVPKNITNGEYTLVAKVYYNGNVAESSKKLTISSAVNTGNSGNIIENTGNTITYSIESNSNADINTKTYSNSNVNSIGNTITYSIEENEEFVFENTEPVIVSVQKIKLDNGKVLRVYDEYLDSEERRVNDSFMESAKEYTKDPMTKSLLYVLNALFIIGIIIFISCIIYVITVRYR